MQKLENRKKEKRTKSESLDTKLTKETGTKREEKRHKRVVKKKQERKEE